MNVALFGTCVFNTSTNLIPLSGGVVSHRPFPLKPNRYT